MSDDDPIMIDCFLCSRPFQFGPHVYNGRHVQAWDIMICSRCDKGNWDGVVPANRPHFEPYLRSKGIEVRYKAKGWIDIPT
jgi:hypothetical protein